MLSSFIEVQPKLLEVLLGCSNGIKLTQLGFETDIEYCSQMNITDIVLSLKEVPPLKEGVLIPYRSRKVCSS